MSVFETLSNKVKHCDERHNEQNPTNNDTKRHNTTNNDTMNKRTVMTQKTHAETHSRGQKSTRGRKTGRR